MQVMDFEKVIPGFLIGGLAYTSLIIEYEVMRKPKKTFTCEHVILLILK